MKKRHLALLSLLATMIAVPAFATSKPLKSPARGVVCDQYICANKHGVSRILTRKYLGAGAAKKAFSQGTFDKTQFTFANGVFCDTKEKACHVDRYFDSNGKRSPIDRATTAKLFGK
ncbi:YcgJ family protein [Daeguia caeni]|uniref:YcgJ family protein n=1 Tax=Daeguia caeni TaxID=439612 RepID=A0ABV9H8L3_9HYPH